MEQIVGTLMLAAAASFPQGEIPDRNWCTVGYTIMMPDGREGRVSSIDGQICRVIADGEKYATLIPHFIVEPVYPQAFATHNMSH